MGDRTIEHGAPATTEGFAGPAESSAGQQSPSPIDSCDQTSAGQPVLPAEPQSGPGDDREPTEGHDRFATGELAMVCSHYELGVISAVREFRRGSRKAPKVVLETSRGRVLLKRRAAGLEQARQIAFSHAAQEHLRARSFPVAGLIRTRDGRSSVRVGGGVYEVFEFINGSRYDRSEPATTEAGRTLAYFHRLLAGFLPQGDPPAMSFHNNTLIPRSLRGLADKLDELGVQALGERLASAYELASGRGRSTGLAAWPRQVIHCDYHPGNLIFDGGVVRALVDFDACRVGPRVLDVANGALQFSVTRNGLDPSQWPVCLDMARLASFLRGYDGVEGCILSRAEMTALPWLMVECLIAEATMPISRTGRFGSIDGVVFLEMVEQKAAWLTGAHAEVSSL